MAGVAHPAPEAEVVQVEIAGLSLDGQAVGQLEAIQERVLRPALALVELDAEQTMVPVEKAVEETGVAAADAGPDFHECGGAEISREPDAEPEDLCVEIVPRGGLEPVLDRARVIQRKPGAPSRDEGS